MSAVPGLGINVATVYTSLPHGFSLGETVADPANPRNTFVLCQASGAVVADDAVQLVGDFDVETADGATDDIFGWATGVGAADNEYFWVQIAGTVDGAEYVESLTAGVRYNRKLVAGALDPSALAENGFALALSTTKLFVA